MTRSDSAYYGEQPYTYLLFHWSKGLGDASVLIITTRRTTQNMSPRFGESMVYTLLLIYQYLYLVLFWALCINIEHIKLTQKHSHSPLLSMPTVCLFVCFSLSSTHFHIMSFNRVFLSVLNILLLPLLLSLPSLCLANF